jgi:hypothetical protein
MVRREEYFSLLRAIYKRHIHYNNKTEAERTELKKNLQALLVGSFLFDRFPKRIFIIFN